MKVRLTQKGYENFEGQMGSMFFKDGLSEDDVIPRQALRLSAVLGCEWEDGTTINPAQVLLDNMGTPAPTSEEIADANNADKPKSNDLDDAKGKAEAAGVTYSEEELAKLADEQGIAGIRAIATPLGLKGNSIQGLIKDVLKAAGAPAQKAE